MRRHLRRLRSLTGIILFLIAWELAVRVLHIPDYILPAPSVILADVAKNWRSLLGAAGFTVQPMILGFLVAVVAGVLIALAIAFSRACRPSPIRCWCSCRSCRRSRSRRCSSSGSASG